MTSFVHMLLNIGIRRYMIPIDFKYRGQRSRSYWKSGNHRIIKQTFCQMLVLHVRLIDVCSICHLLLGCIEYFILILLTSYG